MVIEDQVNNGDFGIRFQDAPTDPQTNYAITGDLNPLLDINGNPKVDAWGNIISDDTTSPNRNDTIYDTNGNDRIEGKGGNDTIYAFRGGDDWLLGGDGNDIIDGGTGSDIIEGGAGFFATSFYTANSHKKHLSKRPVDSKGKPCYENIFSHYLSA